MGVALALAAGCVHAQPDDRSRGDAYPAKPVRFVVGQAPGGATDIMARALAQKLTAGLGQSVVVDNRAGAAGSIGAALVAKSQPDGYTLLFVSSSFSINPNLYPDLPFDPVGDFAPVALIAEAPFLLVVHPALPAKSVAELIALAKSKLGGLNYASGGNGSSGHLAGELFQNLAGVKITHVPYKGAAPGTVDVIGGQIDITFASVVSVLPHVTSGKLRALGATGARRVSALPQLPTLAEAGVKGYSTVTWYGVLAPKGAPSAVIGRLNAAIAAALQQGDFKERLSREGADAIGGTPAQFANYLDAEIRKWARVIRESNIRVD